MVSQLNRDRAVELVDSMVMVPDEKRQTLRNFVSEAAMGDEVALTHVILFPYRREDYGIVSRIINLIFSARH